MSTDTRVLAPTSSEKAVESCPRSTSDPVGVDVPGPTSPLTPSPPALREGHGAAIVKRRPTRAKAPKDSKIYKIVLAVIALRAQGVKAKQIAETLGYSEDVLRQYVSRAYKKGWINLSSFNEVDDQLEYILKHKVVRNVNEFLDGRDKDVTLEAAKGLGMFKQPGKHDTGPAPTMGLALAVNVTVPPNASQQTPITIRPGTLGGARGLDVPLDADVMEDE